MFKNLNDIIISEIALAVYVPAGTGNPLHSSRPFHGLVINDIDTEKNYHFSDGSILHTSGGEIFYLPKNSSYVVKEVAHGGCYAINFDANISDTKPFSIKVRNFEGVSKLFRDSGRKWRQQSEASHLFIRRCVYDIMLEMHREFKKNYIPDEKLDIIAPALKKLSSDFTDRDISVSQLAKLCSVSEVYFRKIFLNKLGVLPREYIISKRIAYAVQLIESGQFQISEIAYMCGYAEPCHFSREFSKRMGVSPSQYSIKQKEVSRRP